MGDGLHTSSGEVQSTPPTSPTPTAGSEDSGGIPRPRRIQGVRRRGPDGQEILMGPLDWMAFSDAYAEAFNERALQEAIEQSKKLHLLGELPREKYSPQQHPHLIECELCLEEYQEGDELLRLPCAHRFHSKCLEPWLQRSYTCPLCQTDTFEALQQR